MINTGSKDVYLICPPRYDFKAIDKLCFLSVSLGKSQWLPESLVF